MRHTLHLTMPNGHIQILDITDAIERAYYAADGPDGAPVPASVAAALQPTDSADVTHRIALVVSRDAASTGGDIPVLVDQEAAGWLNTIGWSAPAPADEEPVTSNSGQPRAHQSTQGEPTMLTWEQLLTVFVALERRRRATRLHPLLMPPYPPCPQCSTPPTEVIESVDRTIGRPARIHFRPCGHEFTATDDAITSAWDAVQSLLRQQEDRPVGERAETPCPRSSREEPHDAHNWYSPLDGPARCPGYSEPDDGHAEPGPPQSVAEQVRDLERIIERVREAVGTDQPTPTEEQAIQLLRNEIGRLRELIGWIRSSLCEAFGIPDDESIDVIGAARHVLDEARQWARHGYEIGQRHCGWTDHGVPPGWLTEGWPPHIDSCEHLARAAEYDTTLARVRDLPEKPQAMDANAPYSADYLSGYRAAISTAKRAASNEPAKSGEDGSPAQSPTLKAQLGT
jgi:hypothetical protein